MSPGKKGIGLGKRARSPTISERVAKMAKMAEDTSHRDYRDRTRQEYEDRRAEGKLSKLSRHSYLSSSNQCHINT